MPFQISVKAQAACAGCGREIKLKEPVIKGELRETDKRPITHVFGDHLGTYNVCIHVKDTESCFVVDGEILCDSCNKEYENAVASIDMEAHNKKRRIIGDIRLMKAQEKNK
jgi:predicted Fe-S protein YdhL (DUF1289 family)